MIRSRTGTFLFKSTFHCVSTGLIVSHHIAGVSNRLRESMLLFGMVERYRRGKGKAPLLGSHQKCWLWGRNVVLETLRGRRWPVLELYCSDQLPQEELDVVHALAEQNATSVRVEPGASLRKRCHSAEHQGYLAKMPDFPYVDPLALLDQLIEKKKCPLLVICDAIQDPFNLGALIRSAEVFGVDGIFIAVKYQVGVTSLVARSSAGAVSHVPIARAENLEDIIAEVRGRGIQVLGTSDASGIPVFECDLKKPTAMIIGNEGAGIRDALRDRSDHLIHIPQHGRIASLNAAVSAGILFYEARRQRTRA
ncbi:MAG TPA: 23S rRNA (guanosine(2251)-2'-O)-methyltransferase RlmB [Nitrospirales bacterium]|nr:23S rRNA (guanosine(2251)-2'-O)-methyltransferase RlmB [Nitrospirales bacterium]HIB54343.1 23S rRNA (guanosine(2251)-2'-O)-methyltransferase RlmB [Nitrospirales bacterium]HIN33251.1 23S rRNA (guanosine(2251)-2'-O)-methyltransferase RlmB [Nitrospirales bacterium]HIO22036.1 23S rRNA (guanosine(2251)-2'-O)-methyltransferase RlmB [Nitrospirales bacterium]